MKRKNTFFLILFTALVFINITVFSQTGPGGVGDMTNTQLWLRADKGVFYVTVPPSIQVIYSWRDQSGQSRDFTAIDDGQGVPVRTPASLNGLPVVTFTDDGTDGEYLGYEGDLGFSGSDASTVFIVARNNETDNEQNGGLYIGEDNVGAAGQVRSYGLEHNSAVRFNGEDQIFNDGHTAGNWKMVTYSNPSAATVADYRAWLDGTLLTGTPSSSTVPSLTASVALVGATQMGGTLNAQGYLTGDIAEIVVYSSELNDASRVVVENSLAAKYNLPISNDHYAYQATHSFDVSGIAGYNGTVFTTGKSSVISINSPTDLSDNEYLFYGHDNASALSWTTTEVPASSTYRLAREWMIDETSEVGTVTVTVPASAIPSLPAGYTNIAIVTDADGDFTSGATAYLTTLNAGNYEVSLDLSTGMYLTIIVYRLDLNFTVTSASGDEGVATVNVQVTQNYSFPSDITAQYAVTGGTATNGSDYNLVAGNVTVYAGATTGSFSFTVVDDAYVEPDETVIIGLSNPSPGVTIGSNDTYTYTILNNDIVYASFSSATASEAEGNASHAVGSPQITVSGGILIAPATVNLTVTNGTATADDWSQTSVTITIPAGDYSTPANIAVPSAALSILGDNTVEDDETINLALNTFSGVDPGTILSAVYTILNDDTSTISVGTTTPLVTEGGPGAAGSGTFTFTLTNMSAIARTVNYTVAGTASSGTDFVALSGSFVMPANTYTYDVTLTSVADLLVEGDETVSVTITGISGTPAISVNATPAVITLDDDDLPEVLYSPSSVSVNEGSSTTIEVWLANPPVGNVVLDLSVLTGEVSLGTTTLTFTTANYSTHQVVTVNALEDNMMGDNTDNIIISVNDALSDDPFDPLADINIPVNVINNDIAALVITPGSVSVDENGTVTFSVSLSAGPSSGNVTVDLVSNDLSVATISIAQLTFTALNWNVPQIVTVTGVNNNIIPNTSTTISLSVNNALSDDDFDDLTGTVNVNVNNDDIAGFTVAPLTLTINEGGPAGTFTIVLNAQPTGSVVFDLVNVAPVYLTNISQVTFTNANWNVPQVISVTAIEDLLDADRTDVITVTVNQASSDDDFDAMASQNVTVTIEDNDPPVITGCPSNITVNSDAGVCTAVVTWTAPTSTAPMVSDHNPGETFPLGTTTVTYTSTDEDMMVSYCIFTVTVNDTEPPVISCPANLTGVAADAGLCYATGVSLGSPSTSDNCGVASVTNDAPAQFPQGVTTVTWTVTDNAGLTATCVQTVEVVDTQVPTITCPANLTNIPTNAGQCYATGISLGTPVTADNCTVASVTNNAPAQFPAGVTTVTWTVTDGAGLTATCNQTVEVVDLQGPSITCPPNINNIATDPFKCYATGVSLGTPVVVDNCGTVASVTNDAPAQFPVGTTTVTWTATDNGGNSATCTQTVKVIDTQAPNIVCPASLVNIPADPDQCYATGIALGTPMTSDNCAVVSLTNNAPAQFPIGTTTVTWTVTDNAGLTATCVQTVQVVDAQAPSIICPADLTGVSVDAGQCYASGINLGTPVTFDNCAVVSVTNNAPAQFPIGITTVTWTVTDSKGLTSTCTQSVEVVDNELPVISCPADLTGVAADAGSCFASGVALGTPLTSDNCGVASVTNDAPAQFPIGNTTVTWIVTDSYGLTATCTQTVNVVDSELPLIACPPDITGISVDPGLCYATGVALGSPVVSDNCGVATVTNDAPAQFPVGITTVTWTVTDNGGLTNTCTQSVEVVDDQLPTITCPADISGLTADPGSCYASGVSLGTPVTSDNCAVASVTNDAPAQFPAGTTTVTWTVTDNSGLTATCTQQVTVIDNEPPTITCPADLSGVPADAGLCYATAVALGTPLTSDNCGIATVTNDAPAQFPTGNTVVTWTVTDNAGLTATCTQNVEVIDNQPPVITCPSDISSLPADAGSCFAGSVALGSPITSDNCGVATVTNDAPAQFPVGITTVTWTVTDINGLTATCTQNVEVVDDQPPTITCPADIINLPADAGQCYASGVALGTPVTTDNCGVASVTSDAPAQFPIGTTTVTWTVTDNSGLTATCTQQVSVIDGELPTITCPADITGLSVDAGLCYASSVDLGTPVTSDNCGIASVVNDAPAQYPVGTTTVTWTVTDNAGLTATCIQSVEVLDTEAPQITCPADIINVPADIDQCYSTAVVLGIPVATDNCGIASVTSDAPAQFPVGTTTVTWTATDVNGVTATCTHTVQVVDTQSPTIICPGEINDVNDPGQCGAIITWAEPFNMDNCPGHTISSNYSSGDLIPVGTTTVNYTATDASGNTANCSFNINVSDVELPVIVAKDITIVLDNAGNASIIADDVITSLTDNCPGVTATIDISTFTCASIGANTVTITATDAYGNISTATAVVTVVDDEAPVVTCVPVTVYLDATGNASIVEADIVPSPATDNCGVASVTLSQAAFTCTDLGDVSVTVTATDGSGNIGTCSSLVTVVDTFSVAVYAGPDDTICNTDLSYAVTAATSYNAVVSWSSSGTGSFDDPALLNPVYTFAATDPLTVTLTVTATKVDGCTSSVTDEVIITRLEAPVADAGNDTTLCSDMPDIDLSDVIAANGVIAWTTSGDGFFSDVTSANPVYTFGAGDIASSSVTLTVNVYGGGLCADASDDKIITFIPAPVANAGGNGSLCGSETGYQVTGATHLNGSVQWSSSGNGTFDDNTLDNPYYTFGSADFSLGSVTLTMTVTGGAECTPADSSVVVTINPLPAIVVVRHDNVSCPGMNDGEIELDVSVGLAPIGYSIDGGLFQPSGTFTGLAPASYYFQVMDSNGCLSDTTITIVDPLPFTMALDSVKHVMCNGTYTGEIYITAEGGTTPYNISWTGPDGFTASTEDITGLAAGLYSLVITDLNACATYTLDTLITEPAAIVITAAQVSDYDGYGVKCYSSQDGYIEITVTGGTGPLVYSWSGPDGFTATTDDIYDLYAGIYSLTVTDSTGCTLYETYTLAEPDQMIITAEVQDASCPQVADGSVDISVEGGAGTLAYLWDDGITTEDRPDIVGGDHTVTVTDANGCSEQYVVHVDMTLYNCLKIYEIITPNGDGRNDTWKIEYIEYYPDAEIFVYTRWGKLVFHTRNASTEVWDGRVGGKVLPNDSYHYVIYLNNGSEPRTGVISIISK